MARGLNKVMIIGRLGRDPEMRYTPSGKPVTSFSVAVSRTYTKPEGERVEETDWFNVVAWGRLAEICSQYLTKGSLVYVEGRLETRSWEGDNGQKHYRTEVVAGDVNILDRKGRPDEGGAMDSAIGDIGAPGLDEPSI
ncbi:MAG: Single-stranded DNA-binding protein [Anaerolineae bacterium]|nr:Single-stranded DNA-binding protein [Anaerolineae bacterium]MDL1897655.1 single-stranded DNA-binding protein [Anaerolineae bacterium CFX7]